MGLSLSCVILFQPKFWLTFIMQFLPLTLDTPFKSGDCVIILPHTEFSHFQNFAMRLLTFNGPKISATPLYSELRILKLFDQVEIMNILYVHKYLNGKLPVDTLKTLNFEKVNHSFATRGNVIGLLKQPSATTTNFGLYSFSNISVNQWNNLQKNHPNLCLSELRLSKLKTLSTKFYLNKYTDF